MEIKRDVYLNRLIRREKNGLIKVITGVRRCGKSYMLFNLFHNHLLEKGVREDHIIEIALDDRSNKELRDPDKMLSHIKERIVDKDTYYIILDEVQLIDEFEDVLNSLMHIRNADVYVTGSNSKFLSSDLVTEFRGRGDEIRIYPLSFREYCSVYQGSADEAWDDYFTYGGLPLILSRETPEESRRLALARSAFRARGTAIQTLCLAILARLILFRAEARMRLLQAGWIRCRRSWITACVLGL